MLTKTWKILDEIVHLRIEICRGKCKYMQIHAQSQGQSSRGGCFGVLVVGFE